MLLVGGIALVVALAAAIALAQPADAELEGTWVLVCYSESRVPRIPYPSTWILRRGISLVISDTRITGYAGVNRYWANYEVDNGEFAIYSEFAGQKHMGVLFQTLAGGPRHLGKQEGRYLSLLRAAQHYEIRGRLLIISSEEGLLVFARSIRS